MATAGGEWGTLSPRRRRRLWAALIGGALLLAGFHRRSTDAPPSDVPVPEPATGRPPHELARQHVGRGSKSCAFSTARLASTGWSRSPPGSRSLSFSQYSRR